MKNETSVTHHQNIESGLTVEWVRTSAGDSTDKTWDVVAYSDGSRWLFDNASGSRIALLGSVSDGLNTCEILETETGRIIALYGGGIESYWDREAWLESIPAADRDEAKKMLSEVA